MVATVIADNFIQGLFGLVAAIAALDASCQRSEDRSFGETLQLQTTLALERRYDAAKQDLVGQYD